MYLEGHMARKSRKKKNTQKDMPTNRQVVYLDTEMICGYLLDDNKSETYKTAENNIKALISYLGTYIVKISQVVVGEFSSILCRKNENELKGWESRNKGILASKPSLDEKKKIILGQFYDLIRDLNAELPPVPPETYRLARILMCLNNPHVGNKEICFEKIDETNDISYNFYDGTYLTSMDVLILAHAIADEADYLLTTDNNMVGNPTVQTLCKKIGKKPPKVTDSINQQP